MSNIGKRIINIPSSTFLKGGNNLHIKINKFHQYKQLILSFVQNYSLKTENNKKRIYKYINFPSYYNLNLIDNLNNKQLILSINPDNISNLNFLNNKNKSKLEQAFFGTLNSFIFQMIESSFKKILFLNGIGYKIEIESIHSWSQEEKREKWNYLIKSNHFFHSFHNDVLKFTIGYSHPIFIQIPSNIEYKLLNSNTLELYSHSLQDLTQFLHKIIQIKPAYKDKYKNKGFQILTS